MQLPIAHITYELSCLNTENNVRNINIQLIPQRNHSVFL